MNKIEVLCVTDSRVIRKSRSILSKLLVCQVGSIQVITKERQTIGMTSMRGVTQRLNQYPAPCQKVLYF